MICHIVSPRDTKTPSENPDGVLVSCPRCAPTRPKARAGCVALRLAARLRAGPRSNRAVAPANGRKSSWKTIQTEKIENSSCAETAQGGSGNLRKCRQ
jgi:hypothetical protein